MEEEIKSLDDLLDRNAKKIAIAHSLSVNEILPKYLELIKELEVNDGEINIDMNNPNTPINIYDGYIKKVACGAVISYEFTKRHSIKFPIIEIPILNMDKEVFIMLNKIRGEITRNASISVYHRTAFFYEMYIGILTKHKENYLENL